MDESAAASIALPVPSSPRPGSAQDRRGRGKRGPLVLPGPWSPRGRAQPLSSRDAFDELVLTVVVRLTKRWPIELKDVEFATEEVPPPPEDWADQTVEFGCMVTAAPGRAPRVMIFRQPVELRTKTRLERLALIHEVLVDQVAKLLGRDPHDL